MRSITLGALCTIFLTACATPSRFEWGAYEPTLYAYAKTPEARETYRKALASAIEVGEETGRLAPGMYAELGYLFVEDENIAEAVSSFQKEMENFPESRVFLTSVVSRLTAGSARTAAPASPPADTSAPSPNS